MYPARIAELLAPFLDSADDRLCQHISTYIDILLRWNARINLTAIRDPEEIVTRHFGESLFAARHLFSSTARVGTAPRSADRTTNYPITLADLGSGAGFPGLPIKLWAPHISLTLIESNHKKSTFLREVTRALTLTDINVLTTRAEDLLPANRFDVVTLRAVERFAGILPTAASLVGPGGRLALLIGTSQLDQVHALGQAFTLAAPIPIPQSASRVLLIAARNLGSLVA